LEIERKGIEGERMITAIMFGLWENIIRCYQTNVLIEPVVAVLVVWWHVRSFAAAAAENERQYIATP
jgi:hypothetical protein